MCFTIYALGYRDIVTMMGLWWGRPPGGEGRVSAAAVLIACVGLRGR